MFYTYEEQSRSVDVAAYIVIYQLSKYQKSKEKFQFSSTNLEKIIMFHVLKLKMDATISRPTVRLKL